MAQVAGIVPLVEAACHHAPPIGTCLEARHLGQGATHRVHLDLSHKHIHLLIGKDLHHIVDAVTIPLQGREFRYFTAVLGIEQDGLGGLTGHNTRHHWCILILPTVENGHGIAVTFPLVFRQRVRRPVTHTVDILLLAAEVLVLHAIGDGIDDISHIGNAVPRERAVTIGKIGDRLIGLVRPEPGRSGIQRYRRVEAVLEPCAQLTHLAVDDLLLVSPRAVAEIDHARIAACCHCLTHDTSLLDKLGKCPSLLIGNPLADEDVAVETRRHLAPPRRDTGKRARRLPINLRSQEIDGAARHPSHRVAVNLVILPVAAHRTRLHTIFVGYSLGGACHTGRTDAEAHPRLRRLDHVVDILDHLVDILTPPVALRHGAAARFVGIIQVGIERERRVVLVVEIVVKYQTVNIILVQNVLAHVHHTLAHLGDAWIEHGLIAGRQEPLGMGMDVVQFALSPHVVTMAIAVRVDPGIDLDAPLVGFLNQVAEGVKRRRHTTGSRDITGPRLIGRVIHRVAHRPDVVVNRIDVIDAQGIKHLAAGILHDGRVACRDGSAGPVVQI